MFNIVELIAEEQQEAPCKHGNIVVGHACYCHLDEWEEGPRKCPIYRNFGGEKSKWIKREWELIDLPMLNGFDDKGNVISEIKAMPCMPDDDLGGCPMFEQGNSVG